MGWLGLAVVVGLAVALVGAEDRTDRADAAWLEQLHAVQRVVDISRVPTGVEVAIIEQVTELPLVEVPNDRGSMVLPRLLRRGDTVEVWIGAGDSVLYGQGHRPEAAVRWLWVAAFALFGLVPGIVAQWRQHYQQRRRAAPVVRSSSEAFGKTAGRAAALVDVGLIRLHDDVVRSINAVGRRMLGVRRPWRHRRLTELSRSLELARVTSAKTPVTVDIGARQLRFTPLDLGEESLVIVQDMSAQSRVRRQDDLMRARIAHEVKTPLATLMATLSAVALAETGRLPSGVVVTRLQRATMRVERIASELLELQEGAASHEMADVSDILHAVDDEWRGDVEEAGGTLDIQPSPTTVEAPAIALKRILSVYLSNAVKHAGPSPHVVVAVQLTQAHVVVIVRDDGPGLAEGVWRGGDDVLTARSMSGMGLPIASSIAATAGMDVGGEAKIDGGSEFWVRTQRP